MNTSTRALWLAFMILFGLLVGAAAGLLTWADGESSFAAVRAGGTSFGGALALLFGIFYFATHGGPKS
ncbi:hypothetical protein [Couchioplanes azureus]|uniref:hypothetical protein n=1 Tax=Couchioplanes caeruleus TaxID=56438 RepID=UPI00167176D7|nr:hypothetical protein [Couchioplanes caeruleus]GGQ67750.1 hypothetical protein GCM10010166_42170 [Couchioplanes caeruleus subsp. azureus]